MSNSQITSLERILVTGGRGFIGTHLVRRLRELGANVTEIRDRRDCDLRNFDAVRTRYQAIQPQVIIHLAASLDNRQQAAISSTSRAYNTIISVSNLLQAIPQHQPCLFVHVGSYKQYGYAPIPFREQGTVKPAGWYGLAKYTAERLVRRRQSDTFQGIFLRLGSVFGPGQNHQQMIPHIICSILRGECHNLSVVDVAWDPVYISDIVDGICMSICQAKARGEVINLSGGVCYSPRQVVGMIASMLNQCGELCKPPQADLVALPCWGDISYARQMLEWEPKVPLLVGLQRTIEYYQAQLILQCDFASNCQVDAAASHG